MAQGFTNPYGNSFTGSGAIVKQNSPDIITPNIIGVTDGSNAAAGSVGEYISSSVLVGSAVALVSGTPKTITSISLTAGDWDISGTVVSNPAAGTTTSTFSAGVSTVNNTFGTAGAENNRVASGTAAANVFVALNNGQMRMNLSSPTTVYLIASCQFAVSTMTAYGFIGARRVR